MNAGFSFFFLLFSLVFTYVSLDFNFMKDGKPGDGFFPMIVGVPMIIMSAISFFEDFKKRYTIKADLVHFKDIVWVVIMSAVLIFLMKYIGATLSMVLFVFVILTRFNRQKIVQNMVISISFSVVLFFMFDFWLNAGLPKGFLGFM